MSLDQKHHYIVEHIWRALRASLLLLAMFIWLLQDGFSFSDGIVLTLGFLAHLTEQFHGYICKRIERILKWKEDFNDWE